MATVPLLGTDTSMGELCCVEEKFLGAPAALPKHRGSKVQGQEKLLSCLGCWKMGKGKAPLKLSGRGRG